MQQEKNGNPPPWAETLSGRRTRVAAGTLAARNGFAVVIRRGHDSESTKLCLFVCFVSAVYTLQLVAAPPMLQCGDKRNEDVTNNRPRTGSLTSSNSSSGAGATPRDAFQGPALGGKKKDAAASRRVRLGALQSTKDASGCVSSRRRREVAVAERGAAKYSGAYNKISLSARVNKEWVGGWLGEGRGGGRLEKKRKQG